MRRINIVLFTFISILLGALAACQPTQKNGKQNSTIEKLDSCLNNPSHTYNLFIPLHDNSFPNLPLLIAIDSHGSGQTAINHLKEAVSAYPAILVASNLIQNNDPNYIQELNELIADVKKRYPVGERIYLAGFSGGARMALNYAVNHRPNGVIACGAFADKQQLAAVKCPVTGIVGMDDFNFPEVAPYILQPKTTPANVHIELSEESHEWPSPQKLTNVFGWFQMADKSASTQQIKKFAEVQKLRIDSFINNDDLLQAACIGRNMSAVKTFEKEGSFQDVTHQLTSSNDYHEQLSQLTKSLQLEFSNRNTYGQALFEKDENWWKNEISALNERTKSEPNTMNRMAYKRLKGFLGIICYSYTRQLAEQKDIPHLEQILMVYRLTEPENTEMKRYSELLNEWKKQPN